MTDIRERLRFIAEGRSEAIQQVDDLGFPTVAANAIRALAKVAP